MERPIVNKLQASMSDQALLQGDHCFARRFRKEQKHDIVMLQNVYNADLFVVFH